MSLAEYEHHLLEVPPGWVRFLNEALVITEWTNSVVDAVSGFGMYFSCAVRTKSTVVKEHLLDIRHRSYATCRYCSYPGKAGWCREHEENGVELVAEYLAKKAMVLRRVA